jgi:serine/threonine protein kinase
VERSQRVARKASLDSLLGTRFGGLLAGPELLDKVGAVAAGLWGAGHASIRAAQLPVPLEVYTRLEGLAKMVRNGQAQGRDLLSSIRNAFYYDDFFVSFLKALESWSEDGPDGGDPDETRTVDAAEPPVGGGSELRENTVVGPFELLELLGSGGAGDVYKARQPLLNRHVAIKVLRPALEAEESMVERFQNEARAVAELQHPNIVRLIDIALCPTSGVHYIALEYVPGPSLDDLLEERGTIDEREALTITLGIARALSCAAKHGFVHRDVKPANILIGEEGVPKLADLGLAKRVDANACMTTMGLIMGTPHFIAPEQAMGEDVDVRSDLYSLGLTLFTCLAGRPPFKARTAIGVITQHVNLDVPDVRIFNPEISTDSVELISWLSARKPSGRYPTAEEAASNLERVLSDLRPLPPTTLPVDEDLPIAHVPNEEEVSAQQAPSSESSANMGKNMILSDDMLRAYRVASRLSHGAEGTLYEVEVLGQQDYEGFGDPVTAATIKIGVDKDAVRREGEIYSQLDRRLIALLDQGVDTASNPYLVLERLFLHPGARFQREGEGVAVDPASAVEIFVNLLAGLNGLHFRRKMPLILCNIKPSNIGLRFYCQSVLDDAAYLDRLAMGAYEPVFTDLLAAESKARVEEAEGALEIPLASPEYLASESVGEKGAGTGVFSMKSDVYGLTLSFYTLLTGERPYAYRGVYQLEDGLLRSELLEFKRTEVDPYRPGILEERFGAELASVLDEVLRLGTDPEPETRFAASALLWRCHTLFKLRDVEREELASIDDPRLGLRFRQDVFPRLRRGSSAYKVIKDDP